MALTLNLPVIKDNPATIAETRAPKIMDYLTTLHTQSLPVGASSLLRQLIELNRQKISPNLRIQALDLYRPSVLSLTHALSEHYIDATLPLQVQIKAAATSAESLWLELGYGYKLALIDLQNQLIKKGNTSAHCIQSAMHAITEYTMVYYQTYTSPPSHVWGDLHQLYFCAVQLGVQNLSIANLSAHDIKNKNHTTSPTIESLYKQALLIYLADTQRLSAKNIRLTTELLAAHVKKVYISSVAPLESAAASFIIHLNSNDPPTPFSKQQVAPNPNTDILLLTIDLVQALHQQLGRLQSNPLVNDSRDNEMDLLTHLIKHWGITPTRIFRRLAKNGDLELVAGISAIHISANVAPTLGQATRPPLPSRWQILNISATGMSIRRHPTAEKNIQIGSIIGIKTKLEPHWTLGVVRWANCGGRDKLDIGVQLIAPQAKNAVVRMDKRDNDEDVLLIPQNNATKQSASLIVPKGTYEPARRLTLTYNNEVKFAMLTKLVERTAHFEQVHYNVID